jgi:transposase-like protein
MAWRLKVLHEAADEQNVARVCRRFGISRKSFYKWKRRHAAHDTAVFKDATRAAHRPAHRGLSHDICHATVTDLNALPARTVRPEEYAILTEERATGIDTVMRRYLELLRRHGRVSPQVHRYLEHGVAQPSARCLCLLLEDLSSHNRP